MRTEPWERKVRPITDITSTALERQEMEVCMNSLKKGQMLHVDPILGNDRKIRSYTTTVVR
jgi:hypothetical protein